jgi:glutathione S-transferase
VNGQDCCADSIRLDSGFEGQVIELIRSADRVGSISCHGGALAVTRFTLYGSPHSLPTYKVALILRLSGEPFSFRYVSFQKGVQKTPEFQALSRWGQVPVLVDGGRVLLQSAAIVEHVAEELGRFQGSDPAARQAVREWMYWDLDALYPPVFGCYSVQLGQKKLLPIDIEPTIADYHRRRAETALSTLNSHLAPGGYLCASEPTLADLFCYGDVAFAEICAFEIERWPNLADWAERVKALPGFKAPFDLLQMQDAEVT